MRFFSRLLRVSAFYKILIANSILILAGAAAGFRVSSNHSREPATIAFLAIVVAACVLINSFLIRLALEASSKEAQERGRLHAGYVIAAQEEERKRIARELHDETSQVLASLIMGLEKVKIEMPNISPQCISCKEDVGSLKGLTDKALIELHRLAFNLRPSLIDDLGLKQALSQLLREQVEKQGLGVVFHWEGSEERLPAETEIALFRIIQEAVTNAVKYAQAGKISVALSRNRDKVDVEISDDGIGFDMEAVQRSKENRLGLMGMEERVSLLQGTFSLQSAAGKGTRVSAAIPI